MGQLHSDVGQLKVNLGQLRAKLVRDGPELAHEHNPPGVAVKEAFAPVTEEQSEALMEASEETRESENAALSWMWQLRRQWHM